MSSISYDLIFKEGDPLIFDTHTDILYNIVAKRLKGKRGIVEDYHIPEQLEGNITGEFGRILQMLSIYYAMILIKQLDIY